MKYPTVLGELQTALYATAGASIARFGDGELRIAVGGDSISQRGSLPLTKDLRAILAGDYAKNCLTCIPNLQSRPVSPHYEPFYKKYGAEQFTRLMGEQPYGSTWVTRADCAPWIDRPEYWELFRGVWRGKSVTLIAGAPDMGLLLLEDAAGAVDVIPAPKRDAYAKLGEIIEEVGKPSGPVIISLGAAGTVLAAKLARAGVWALDLGHLFMFMRKGNMGAFAFTLDDFASPEYRRELQAAHADHFGAAHKGKWGRSGHRHWNPVKAFMDRLGAKWVLDYGSGAESFKVEAERDKSQGYRVEQFDVGTDKIALPKQVDVCFSSDVLEHVEPEKIDNVMRFLFLIARKGGWHKIALKPANKILPITKRNAHILLRSPEWWADAFRKAGWSTVTPIETTHKHVTFELTK